MQQKFSVVFQVFEVLDVLLVELVLILGHYAHLQQLVEHFVGVLFRVGVVDQHVHEVRD